MAFDIVNTNNLVGSMSPENLSLALNGGGIHILTNTVGAQEQSFGAIRCPIPAKTAKVRITAEGALGVGEILVLSLRYMTSAGVIVNIVGITLNNGNVTAAGTQESDVLDVTGIEVGDVVELVYVYTAGTPNDPQFSITVQFK